MAFRHLLLLAALAVPTLAYVIVPKATTSPPLPLLIWHGLGDSFNASGIQDTAALAQQINPGTYVYRIRLAEHGLGDREATFLGNVTTQLEQVCQDIAADPILSRAPAVNALGFSQGGQFLRGYVERCNAPPVRNLVTFGSQHNGIAEFEDCARGDLLCRGANGFLTASVWSDLFQNHVVPAQYFRDPDDLESYLESSNFLADINNERRVKRKDYKANLAGLDKFVMYLFENDTVVIPKESAWFAEVNPATGEVTPLQDRDIYKEDWLGLKELDKKNGLVFATTPGQHMRIDQDVLAHVFKKYFSPRVELLTLPLVWDEASETAMHAEPRPGWDDL